MYSKSKVQGSTIIEVMVSVFLLTFGILALLMAQIRSVAGIGEAENRTLIAQAAESLAEGMQANPVDYTQQSAQLEAKIQSLSDLKSKSSEDLKNLQISNFVYALNQIPDVENINYFICKDKKEPKEPDINNGNCDGSDVVMIKVAWQMKQPNSRNANATETYTYMLKVKH